MSEVNLYCDSAKCSNLALVFGFLPGALKKKVCEQHMLVLVEKQVATFPISSFHFIESVMDVPRYEERKRIVEKGLGSLGVWESRCDQEWKDGQALLQSSSESVYEVFQRTYQELWEQGKQSFDDAKQKLADYRSRFEQLLKDKSIEFSEQDLYWCESVPPGSPFRLIMGDCREDIARTVLTHFHPISAMNYSHGEIWDGLIREQVAAERLDVACEIRKYSLQLGYPTIGMQETASVYTENTAETLTYLLPHTATEADIQKFALKSESEGGKYVKTGEYYNAVEEFEKGRKLMEMRGLKDSEMWLRESNALAETYYQVERYKDCGMVCAEVLKTWGRHRYAGELWRAVFFLAESLYIQGDRAQGQAVVQEWTAKLESDPGSQSTRFFVYARMLSVLGQNADAVRNFTLGFDQQHHSQTYLTAYCRLNLGILYQLQYPQQAEEQFAQSLHVFSDICPYSISTCICLNTLGGLYRNNSQYILAEEYLNRCYSIVSSRFPGSDTFGLCLYHQGFLYIGLNRKQEAEDKLAAAFAILQAQRPDLASSCEEAAKSLSSN